MMLYECGVRYEKVTDNGLSKKVTELYLVDALSFAEAEGRITKEMVPFMSGEFDVVTIKRTNYSEIVENGADSADKWFKAKLMFVTLDEKTGKEKRQAVYFIVKASDINNAHSVVVEHMKTSVVDYEIATLDETKILDLFSYKVNTTSSNG
jgi:hypothetical protein